MAYASVSDVQDRLTRELSQEEQSVCQKLLDDAAVIIDAFHSTASDDIKATVSCRMVMRAIGDGSATGIPLGATQGSQSALGYSQSWTISSGASGELYLSKIEKQLLGISGNKIGSYSPVEELTCGDVIFS